MSTILDLQQIATRKDLMELKTDLLNLHRMLSEIAEKLKTNLMKEGEKPMFYSPRQFANLIGVSRPTVSRWCQEGIIRATQQQGHGTCWIIPVEELERLRSESDDYGYLRD
ncbi:MAG: helix-turn-helix domain-containing protein [Bacteroidia bacterium]|nr:helix-turn-helix domain-containing protein [Bacteroidia bacterium]MCB9234463.1 helix-turn-helix domain-containing protein [Bacteroidia bacterium]